MDPVEVERMARRHKLHDELCTLKEFGIKKVLFQPPPSVQLEYPAIIYTTKSTYTTNADNKVYTGHRFYQIELIDPDPDTPFIDKLLEMFPMIKHVNNFKTSNLNHDVFDLYY